MVPEIYYQLPKETLTHITVNSLIEVLADGTLVKHPGVNQLMNQDKVKLTYLISPFLFGFCSEFNQDPIPDQIDGRPTGKYLQDRVEISSGFADLISPQNVEITIENERMIRDMFRSFLDACHYFKHKGSGTAMINGFIDNLGPENEYGAMKLIQHVLKLSNEKMMYMTPAF